MSAVQSTGSILAGHFGFAVKPPPSPASGVVVAVKPPVEATAAEASESAFPTLEDVMRQHIERALGLTRGRIEGRGGAADRLGINPHTLRGKMRRLKIDWARFRG